MPIPFDLEKEILKEHSKRQTMKIARWIGSDEKRFSQLMQLFLHGNSTIVQRSAWIISNCADDHPALITPWLKKLIHKTKEPGVHNAVPRNVLRILQFVDIPRSLQGSMANICFDFLSLKETPIAIKAFSMYVLANIAEHEPDLKKELRIVIEQLLPYGSGGIISCGKKVLKRIS